MFNMKTKLPTHIDYFKVHDDGTLERDGMTFFPWINEAGYIGGQVRYKLIAEEVSKEEFEAILNSEGTQQ
jgi:hypothetical protein